MNLGELKGQFQALMNRRDLNGNPALVSTFVDQAVQRVQRELRIPALEKSVNVTISTPYVGLVIPQDMVELINLIPAKTNERLEKTSITRALKLAETTGNPEEYCRQGGVWVLGPRPMTDDVIRVDYYAELLPLVAPTDTNVVSIIAWDLIVYAALSFAGDYFNDDRAQMFEARYTQIKEDLQQQSDNDDLEGATVVMPAYRFPSDFENN